MNTSLNRLSKNNKSQKDNHTDTAQDNYVIECNYANNYYGDQVCISKHRCNYANNYYGDQLCLPE